MSNNQLLMFLSIVLVPLIFIGDGIDSYFVVDIVVVHLILGLLLLYRSSSMSMVFPVVFRSGDSSSFYLLYPEFEMFLCGRHVAAADNDVID